MNDEKIKEYVNVAMVDMGLKFSEPDLFVLGVKCFRKGYEQGKSDAIKLIDEELLIIYNTLQKGMRDCFEWEDGFIAGEETESFIRQLREWLNSLT